VTDFPCCDPADSGALGVPQEPRVERIRESYKDMGRRARLLQAEANKPENVARRQADYDRRMQLPAPAKLLTHAADTGHSLGRNDSADWQCQTCEDAFMSELMQMQNRAIIAMVDPRD
jgi:hypothetical protein